MKGVRFLVACRTVDIPVPSRFGGNIAVYFGMFLPSPDRKGGDSMIMFSLRQTTREPGTS